MKRTVAIITGTGQVTTRDEDVPELRDGEVRLRVHVSLVSPGTEMGGVRARREKPDPAAPAQSFGYANAGEIIESRAADPALRPGLRIAAMGGGYAVHGTVANVPANLVAPIPDDVTFAQAAYACLGATALQSVHRTEPRLGEFGAVLGLGIVGNLAAQLYRIAGARVIAWEGVETRLRIAKACGIDSAINIRTANAEEATRAFAAPYGLDFANVAFGGDATEPVRTLQRCMKKAPDTHEMGRIILVGGCKVTVTGGAGFGNLDLRASSRTGPGYHDDAWEHGRNYPNGFVGTNTQRNLREIIRLMAEKRLLVDPLTTHDVPLVKAGEMADLLIAHPEEAVGVILRMS